MFKHGIDATTGSHCLVARFLLSRFFLACLPVSGFFPGFLLPGVTAEIINERLDGFRIVDFVFDLRHDTFIQQFFVVGNGIGEIQDNGLDTFAIYRGVEIQRQARLGSRALLVLLIIIDTVIVLAEKIGIWTTRIELFIKRIGLCCIFFITRLNLLGVLRDGSSLVFSRLFGDSAFFCRFLLIVASTEQRCSGKDGKRQLILFHRVFLWLWVKSQGNYNDSCVLMGIRYGYFFTCQAGQERRLFVPRFRKERRDGRSARCRASWRQRGFRRAASGVVREEDARRHRIRRRG